jgi:hypothetical protein
MAALPTEAAACGHGRQLWPAMRVGVYAFYAFYAWRHGIPFANAPDYARILSDPSTRAAHLICSNATLPEPVMEFGPRTGGDRLITLRLRALNKKVLPEVFDGDIITGTYYSSSTKRRRKKQTGKSKQRKGDTDMDNSSSDSSSDDDNDDQDEESESQSSDDSDSGSEDRQGRQKRKRRKKIHTHVFRILSVHWGLKAYVNLVMEGASARRGGGNNRSTSEKNCFAVCELVGSSNDYDDLN